MTATEKILEHLKALGFKTRAGGLMPFGEELPLVSGVAWDAETAQLALIAEMDEDADIAVWRQLLFAGSALRHHLAPDGPAAFGTPVVLAVTDEAGRAQLRDLADDLAQRFVIFNRVDLNLVARSAVDDPDRLDDALAPLLPRARRARGSEISEQEVRRFWDMLEAEVKKAAAGLDAVFGEHRAAAGVAVAAELIGDSRDAPSLPAPHPLKSIRAENFRSMNEVVVQLAPVTIVEGANGSGKSSLLEAMELVWAGTSLRRPPGVGAAEYGAHLPRDGKGGFLVDGDGAAVTAVSESPRAELGRSVLTHEAIEGLVKQAPEERYEALVGLTGLEVPNLRPRTKALLDDAKKAADAALARAELPPLARRDSNVVRHLNESLASAFAQELPSIDELTGAEEALRAASAGAYRPRRWPDHDHASAALVHADAVVRAVLVTPADHDDVEAALDDAARKLNPLLEERRATVTALRRLAYAIDTEERATPRREDPTAERKGEAPVPAEVVARWLSHSRALAESADRFEVDAAKLSDSAWAERLRLYAAEIRSIARDVPREELMAMVASETPRSRPPAAPIAEELFTAAGLTRPERPVGLLAPLRDLVGRLDAQIVALERLGQLLQKHPARRFAAHADDVLAALCRFDLSRAVHRAGPIQNASAQLVTRLLHDPLAPVVRELVASIVRFEWYFKPLLIPKVGGKVVLGGLATPNAELDARLVLNSAERTALGLAWFLALHMLQPPERRRVLVLDDPASVFDSANQAGFASTLRAFVRLTQPEQVVVAAHDDHVAATLAEELAPVGAWPASVQRVRCRRGADDCSTVRVEWETAEARSVEEEAQALGLLVTSKA